MNSATQFLIDATGEKIAAVLPMPEYEQLLRAQPRRRPTEAELEEGYRAMAADKEAEAEALEWCEGLVGDVADDEPR